MSFQPPSGVVVAIAVGGSLVLFAVLATSAVLFARVRERRRSTRANATEETRLARHPEGHRNMMADDIPRPKPGILRRSVQDPYTYARGWNKWKAISSCESLPRHPPMAKILEPSISASDSMAKRQSWSFLRRSMGPNALRSSDSRAFPLSPIAERSVANTDISPELSVVAREVPHGNIGKESRVKDPSSQAIDLYGSRLPDSTALTPAPLFHNKRRSYSSGNIGSLRKTDSKPTVSFREPERTTNGHLQRSRFSRSISQPPGLVPNRPIPPLPQGITSSKPTHLIISPVKSSPNRTSGTSFLSANSSVLSDEHSKSCPQSVTDYTSINFLGPPVSGATTTGLGIYDGSKIWDCSILADTVNPPDHSTTANLNKQTATQKSFRVSIQSNLTQSASSGLSMSLLDQQMRSRSESGASRLDFFTDIANCAPAEKRLQKSRRISPSSPLRRNPNIDICDEIKSKRASTSVLQEVSGNQCSPLRGELGERPRSIATDNPFQWDPKTLMKPSKPLMLKGGAKVHKRQNCIRMSNPKSVTTTSAFAPTTEEQEDAPKESNIPGLFMSRSPTREHENTPLKSEIPGLFMRNSQKHQNIQEPPSIPGLDFQLDATHPDQPPTPRSRNSVYSPTMAMARFYDHENHSFSDSDPATPTKPYRQTSRKHVDGYAHRLSVTTPEWPLPADPIQHLTSQPTSNNSSIPPSHTTETTYGAPRPPSTLFRFPEPPLSTRSPSWRFPSPIRGPRDAPPRHHASRGISKTSLGRTSPYKTTPSPRKSNDLRKQVLALRRMNSEAVDGGGRGHVRYLSALGGSPDGEMEEWLGARGAGVGSERVGDVDAGDAEAGRSVKGPREMKTPRGEWERERSLYDDSGILKGRM